MSLNWIRIACVACCLGLTQVACALEFNSWREYQSDHFVLYSDRSVREANALLEDFERYRQAALTIVGAKEESHRERTHIYLFKEKNDYRLVQPDESIAGYYRNTLQGARMVVGAEAKLADLGLVLFHEYAHHITRTGSKIQYPLWYEEGFADLLASAKMDESGVTFGASHPWREATIQDRQFLSLSELLTPAKNKDGQYWDRYYASAWLFVHFLQMQYTRDNPLRADQLRRYLVALHYGADAVEVFPQYFSMPIEEMDKLLLQYAQRSRWKGYRVSSPEIQRHHESRTLEHNELTFLLGDLAFRSGQAESALEILQYANASDASVAPALSLRSVLEAHKGNLAVAQHYMGMAVQMAPENSVVLTNAAHLYWDWSQVVQGDSASEQIEKVMQYAQTVLQKDVDNLEAGYFLARSLGQAGQRDDAIAVMQALYRYRPTDIQLNMDLGSALLQTGKTDLAHFYLTNVVAWDHSLSRRAKAREMLATINELRQQAPVTLSKLPAHLRSAHDH